ncbi:MAG: sodium transporter [Acidobacteria bacterium]|nr:sodium transporter [Acidobacteriota bacterium]
MSLLDTAIVLVSLFGMVAVAGWIASRQREMDDFFLGGRKLPAWALGISLAANQASAISLVGAPAFVALRAGGGLVWLQYELAVPLAMAALLLWGVPLLRLAKGAEVYQAVEVRLGVEARRTLAGLFLIGRGLGAGVILYASALVVEACSGWGLDVSLLVVGLVAVGYTTLGGLVADVLSDVVQFGLLWGGTALATVVLGIRLAREGAPLAAIDPARLAALDLAHHGIGDGATFAFWPMLIGGFFLYVSYYGCDQTQAQRVLAAADEKMARRALVVAALVRFPLVLTYCLFGVMLAALLAAEPAFARSLAGLPPDALVPRFLVTYLPAGVLGVAVAGVLAAALSSIDSAFNSLSAVTVEELLPASWRSRPRRQLLAARAATFAWGVLAVVAGMVFSRAGETTIELVNRVGSALYGPVLALFLLAWRSRRADGRSAVAGAAAGVAANLALAAWAPGVSWLWWNVSGCAVALAAGVALGRGKQPVAPLASERGTRRQALLLVAYFGLIVSLLALITVSV